VVVPNQVLYTLRACLVQELSLDGKLHNHQQMEIVPLELQIYNKNLNSKYYIHLMALATIKDHLHAEDRKLILKPRKSDYLVVLLVTHV